MSKMPRPTGRKLVNALKKTGFEVVRIKSSHTFMRHPDGRITVVPVHAGETIGPGLVAKILRDCAMTAEELAELL